MNIMWFCIPAFGHTNPTIEVVRELVKRNHQVRYYSFDTFKDKIEGTGAKYIPCDSYLPAIDQKEEKAMRAVSTTEMSIKSFETTQLMNDMLTQEMQSFHPDLIVSDSVCFWGKLLAKKFNIPMVCSTTTFAFNQHSSKYMRYSIKEVFDIVFGTGKMNKALKKLEPLGYQVKNVLEIVQNNNDTNTIVYASPKFQPYVETFDEKHYCFAGPSLQDSPITREENKRPLVYISLGTVINNHPDFYLRCIQGLKDENLDVLISCGVAFDPESLGKLPENIKVKQYVNQMEVLGKANLFITHCGMNSASEGLYMAVPEILFPLTGEQQAVAKRITELGAGRLLSKKDAKSPEKIRQVVLDSLHNDRLLENAKMMREDFTQAPGPKGAADFIERVANENN